jgi:hypothetical protein
MQDLEIGNPKFFKTFSIVLSVVDYLENGIRTCLGGSRPDAAALAPFFQLLVFTLARSSELQIKSYFAHNLSGVCVHRIRCYASGIRTH